MNWKTLAYVGVFLEICDVVSERLNVLIAADHLSVNLANVTVAVLKAFDKAVLCGILIKPICIRFVKSAVFIVGKVNESRGV